MIGLHHADKTAAMPGKLTMGIPLTDHDVVTQRALG